MTEAVPILLAKNRANYSLPDIPLQESPPGGKASRHSFCNEKG